jgi:hypothetical protein
MCRTKLRFSNSHGGGGGLLLLLLLLLNQTYTHISQSLKRVQNHLPYDVLMNS